MEMPLPLEYLQFSFLWPEPVFSCRIQWIIVHKQKQFDIQDKKSFNINKSSHRPQTNGLSHKPILIFSVCLKNAIYQRKKQFRSTITVRQNAYNNNMHLLRSTTTIRWKCLNNNVHLLAWNKTFEIKGRKKAPSNLCTKNKICGSRMPMKLLRISMWSDQLALYLKCAKVCRLIIIMCLTKSPHLRHYMKSRKG